MKKFIIEKPFLDILPEAKIGIIVCEGIDNKIKDPDKYIDYLRESQQEAAKFIKEPEFTANPVIRTWRDAFYKFKTKKGTRSKHCSRGSQRAMISELSIRWWTFTTEFH